MIDPPSWTEEQLEAGRARAISFFRKERMEEPLEDYLEAFDEYQGHIEEFLETTVDLAQLVKQALTKLGLRKVAARDIPNVSMAPAPGEFCGESRLGSRKGDIIVRLWDHRVMPIECKVSNSSLNSVKRLNNDAAVKAVSWQRDFGLRQVVPTAVLSGVYKLHNLVDAQERGLTIFWAQDLDPLTAWIERTKS